MEKVINQLLETKTNTIGEAVIFLNKGVYFSGKMISSNPRIISIDKPFKYCSDKFGKNIIETPTDSSYIKIEENNTKVTIKIGTNQSLYYDFNLTPLFEPIVYDNLILNDPNIFKYALFEKISISQKIFNGKMDLSYFKGLVQWARDFPLRGNLNNFSDEELFEISIFKNVTGGDASKISNIRTLIGTCEYLSNTNRANNTDVRNISVTITNEDGLDKLLIDLATISSWRSNAVLRLWGKRTSASDDAVNTIKTSAANVTFLINGVNMLA